MAGAATHAEVRLTVGQASVFRIEEGARTFIAQGVLQVLSTAVLVVLPEPAHDDSDGDDGDDGGGVEVVSGPAPASTPEFLFMRVADFTFPLSLPAVSTLRVADRNYVMPHEDEGVFIGLAVADDVPEAACAALEEILIQTTRFHVEEPAGPDGDVSAIHEVVEHRASAPAAESAAPPAHVPEPSPAAAPSRVTVGAGKVAGALGTGGKVVGGTIVAGASLLGRGIAKGGSRIKRRVKPKAQPVAVSAPVKAAVGQVQAASAQAVQVSTAVVSGVQNLAIAIGASAAAAARKTRVGQKLHGTPASPALHAAKDVTLAALGAVGEVQASLSRAGHILIQSVGAATSDVVTHRYGDEVGGVTDAAFATVGNAYATVGNVKSLGPKRLAKSSVRAGVKGAVAGGEAGGDEAGADEEAGEQAGEPAPAPLP